MHSIKKHFIKSGQRITLGDADSFTVHEALPLGTYMIKRNPQTAELFLQKVDDMELPPKLYGNTNLYTDKFFTTFMDRKASTGILLEGEKGSGKTIQSIALSKALRERAGLSTIIINTAETADDFKEFIQALTDCAIIFDEFEKVYNEIEDQETLLTLLDGTFQTKKLFIFTSNGGYKLCDALLNRPGRIFYRIAYTGLEVEAIMEYCNEKLDNKEYLKGILNISSVVNNFNFDMLKALVEEVNRYKIAPAEAIKLLNIAIGGAEATFDFNVIHIASGLEADGPKGYNYDRNVNPLEAFTRYVKVIDLNPRKKTKKPKAKKANEPEDVDDEGDDDVKNVNISITPDDLKTLDAKNGMYVFETQGYRIVLRKKKYGSYSRFFE